MPRSLSLSFLAICFLGLAPVALFSANWIVAAPFWLALTLPSWQAAFAGGRVQLGKAPVRALMILLILLAAGAPLGLDPARSFDKALRLAGMAGGLILMLAAMDGLAPALMPRARQLLVAGIGLLSLLILAERANGGQLSAWVHGYAGRVASADPALQPALIAGMISNGLGRAGVPLAALIFPAALIVWRQSRPLPALALAITGAIAVWVLPMAATRLGLAAGFAAALLAFCWPRRGPWLIGAGMGLAVILMPLLAAPPGGAKLVEQISGHQADELPPSFQHRLQIWAFTAERIGERPWTGWGLESARNMPGAKNQARVIVNGVPSSHPGHTLLPLHPHNGPLELWLDGGAAAACLAGLLLFLICRAIARAWGQDRALTAAACGAMAALFVNFCVSFGLWQDWWLGTMALVAAALKVAASAQPSSR